MKCFALCEAVRNEQQGRDGVDACQQHCQDGKLVDVAAIQHLQGQTQRTEGVTVRPPKVVQIQHRLGALDTVRDDMQCYCVWDCLPYCNANCCGLRSYNGGEDYRTCWIALCCSGVLARTTSCIVPAARAAQVTIRDHKITQGSSLPPMLCKLVRSQLQLQQLVRPSEFESELLSSKFPVLADVSVPLMTVFAALRLVGVLRLGVPLLGGCTSAVLLPAGMLTVLPASPVVVDTDGAMTGAAAAAAAGSITRAAAAAFI